jgi:hypothetical protein
MPTELLTAGPLTAARLSWPLELDAEVAPSAPAITDERAAALAARLAQIPGVTGVAAEPHCGRRFVLVHLTLDAYDVSDAVDRACAYLHSCAVDAGLGRVVLVAARCPR